MTPPVNEFITLAHQLADRAGPIARKYFRHPLEIVSKTDASPVTIADRDCEMAMRRIIEARYPDHGILGEEYGGLREGAEYVWILDPIDGTAAFVTGLPVFGTLIALAQNQKTILGVIDQPISRERWIGGRDLPTTLNGKPVTTRDCGSIENAAMYITTSDMLTTQSERDRFANVKSQVKMTRFGGDCYSYGLLAAGYVDLVVESQLMPYDFMPLVGVVEGAGGMITDWEGKALTRQSGNQVVAAATPHLHAQALALLNR